MVAGAPARAGHSPARIDQTAGSTNSLENAVKVKLLVSNFTLTLK